MWCARREDGSSQTFRVTEDGAYADVSDEPVELAVETRVSLPHPLRWPDATAAAWGEVLADYELIQPFAQLARPRPALTDEERGSPTLVRPTAPTTDYLGARRRLARCGWSVVHNHPPQRRLDEAHTVQLEFRSVGRSGAAPVHTTQLTLRRDGEPTPWTEASELQTLLVLDQVGAR